MTKQVQLAGTTKQDEVDFITNVRQLFQTADGDTYLKGFFTETLIQELTWRIRNDWTVDIYGELKREREDCESAMEATLEKQTEINELNLKLDSLEDEQKEREAILQRSIDNRCKKITELNAALNEASERAYQSEQKVNRLRQALANAWSEGNDTISLAALRDLLS